MHTRRGWLVVIVVSAIAAAATVDAFLGVGPDAGQPRAGTGRSTTASASDTAPPPAGSFPLPPVRRCKERQLALRPDLGGDAPAVVLVHRAGPECRQRAVRIRVRVTSASGARAEGTLFGPEPDRFRGLFHSGSAEVAAFRYSPACGEQGPYTATVIAGTYVVKMRIPVVRCGQVFPEGP